LVQSEVNRYVRASPGRLASRRPWLLFHQSPSPFTSPRHESGYVSPKIMQTPSRLAFRRNVMHWVSAYRHGLVRCLSFLRSDSRPPIVVPGTKVDSMFLEVDPAATSAVVKLYTGNNPSMSLISCGKLIKSVETGGRLRVFALNTAT